MSECGRCKRSDPLIAPTVTVRYDDDVYGGWFSRPLCDWCAAQVAYTERYGFDDSLDDPFGEDPCYPPDAPLFDRDGRADGRAEGSEA